jgi:hypothetical protein
MFDQCIRPANRQGWTSEASSETGRETVGLCRSKPLMFCTSHVTAVDTSTCSVSPPPAPAWSLTSSYAHSWGTPPAPDPRLRTRGACHLTLLLLLMLMRRSSLPHHCCPLLLLLPPLLHLSWDCLVYRASGALSMLQAYKQRSGQCVGRGAHVQGLQGRTLTSATHLIVLPQCWHLTSDTPCSRHCAWPKSRQGTGRAVGEWGSQ